MKKKLSTSKRNETVEANLGLATHFAQEFQASKMEFDDMVQEARLGLLDAAERFDESRGVKFSTYARWHIMKRIMDAIHNRNEVVRTPRRRPSKICGTLENADLLLDDCPSTGELLDQRSTVDAVREAIKDLPSREAIVVRLRHGVNTERLTLKKVADILGVTAERVRQIQTSGEEKLRHAMARRGMLDQHGAEPDELADPNYETE